MAAVPTRSEPGLNRPTLMVSFGPLCRRNSGAAMVACLPRTG